MQNHHLVMYNCRAKYFTFAGIMPAFSNSNIALATSADIAALTTLINSTYRGESSKLGWTNEDHLIAGETRTNRENLWHLMHIEHTAILKYTSEQQQIIGCVNLQQKGNKIYLSMLAVSPILQGGGIGKHLLKAAEDYARLHRCNAIYMSVIAAREDLIHWYQRRGYRDTGERIPFIEDSSTGRHLQPLEFMLMEKATGS